SGPLLDQLGVSRDTCDNIVEILYRKLKNQLLLHSVSEEESYLLRNGNINDKLDLRIAISLQSTGHQYEDEKKQKRSKEKSPALDSNSAIEVSEEKKKKKSDSNKKEEEYSLLDNGNINDEFNMRITSVLQSTRNQYE
ncbi:hypothetical protein RYX36_032048, partial [Vicia faba]